MELPVKGATSWYGSEDAVQDKRGLLLYWPNRMDRLWKIKALIWSVIAFLGIKAKAKMPGFLALKRDVDLRDVPNVLELEGRE